MSVATDPPTGSDERAHPVIEMILAETNSDWEIPLISPDRLVHWRKVCKQVYHRNATVACQLLVAAQRAWRVHSMRGLAIQLMMLMEAAGFGPTVAIAREAGIDAADVKKAARLITNVQRPDTGGALAAPQGGGVKPAGPRRGKP